MLTSRDTLTACGSDRSPILDAVGCALLRVIGREGIDLSRFEDEDELQPMNNAAADAEDDDVVMVGPLIDKAFFSQLGSNSRTITDTNWVRSLSARTSTQTGQPNAMFAPAGSLHRQIFRAH